MRLSDCDVSPSGRVGNVHPACLQQQSRESSIERRLQREIGVVALVAAVGSGGKRSSAGDGLNCRLLERGSALVDAGTTFVCQGGTPFRSPRGASLDGPWRLAALGWTLGQSARDPPTSSRFTAHGEIFAAAASFLPIPAHDGQRTSSREHHVTVGSLWPRRCRGPLRLPLAVCSCYHPNRRPCEGGAMTRRGLAAVLTKAQHASCVPNAFVQSRGSLVAAG